MGAEIAVAKSFVDDVLTVRARDVLLLTPKHILTTYPRVVDLVYDDGMVVRSTKRKLVYSWYIWEFHRQYPELELLYTHHVDSVLNGQMLSSNTHINLIGRISKYLTLSKRLTSYHEKEKILVLIYYVVNQLFNELPKLAGAYVQSIDILDILEISHDPEILDMKSKLEPTSNSIIDFYGKARKVILDSPKHRDNSLVQFIRMGILNISQVNQCVLARGFPIEVTGTIMSAPIMSNYAAGMVKLWDYVSDSRSASKHLYSAEKPLQDTEYFARRLQIVGTVVESIAEGDCGSTQYLEWVVQPPTFNSAGRQLYEGDLYFMKGKLYLDEESNTLKEISGNEKHLYGRRLNIRSSIFCKEHNQHQVCSTCFGGLWHNVSRFANLGHLCDATLTQQLTQIILSTKHVIASAVGAEFFLKADAQNYLSFNLTQMSFHFKPFSKGSKISMVVNRNTAIGLTDIKLLTDISQIDPKRISSLKSIEIRETLPNGAEVKIPVNVEQNGRSGHFSYEFLQFIREKGWITNEYDHFVFDMSGWNPKYPIIYIPDVEYSYSDHADRIAKVIESTAKGLKHRVQPSSPAAVMYELFNLVNSKIQVNFALLEIMIYANMTPGIDDFGMARHAKNPGMHIASSIVPNRSLGAAYAYSDQFTTITDPRSFFQENRPDSPLDVFLNPREVVASKKALAFSGRLVV